MELGQEVEVCTIAQLMNIDLMTRTSGRCIELCIYIIYIHILGGGTMYCTSRVVLTFAFVEPPCNDRSISND